MAKTLTEQLADANKEIKYLEATNESFQESLSHRDEILDKQKEQLDAKDTILDGLREQIDMALDALNHHRVIDRMNTETILRLTRMVGGGSEEDFEEQ